VKNVISIWVETSAVTYLGWMEREQTQRNADIKLNYFK
jgi:hypothetical protein